MRETNFERMSWKRKKEERKEKKEMYRREWQGSDRRMVY